MSRRGRTAGRGFVEWVTIVPRSDPARFAAMVRDTAENRKPAPGDSGAGVVPHPGNAVRLIWTGQRRISGIDPGVELAFEGMLSIVDGVPTIYNPRYEIIGRPEEAT